MNLMFKSRVKSQTSKRGDAGCESPECLIRMTFAQCQHPCGLLKSGPCAAIQTRSAQSSPPLRTPISVSGDDESYVRETRNVHIAKLPQSTVGARRNPLVCLQQDCAQIPAGHRAS